MTKITKKYKRLWVLFLVVSVLCNLGPAAAYVIMGLCSATLVAEKIALSMTVLIVLMMSAVALVSKATMKSRLWVLLIGLYLCLDHFITPLLIIGICQIVDEWVAAPLTRHYRNKYTINHEIDKRGV